MNKQTRIPGTTTKTKSRELAILLGILVLGLIVRGLYLCENMSKPDFTAPAVDAGFHNYWARGLAFGDWTPPNNDPDPLIRSTPYLRPPGYPYFLAAIYKLTGTGYLAPRIVQITLGLLNCCLVFLICKRWFNLPVAIIGTIMMATSWHLIYFEQEFHAVSLFIFFLLGAIYTLNMWMEKGTAAPILVSGVLLGISALIRPTALLFIPIVALWLLYISRRKGYSRKFIPACLCMLIGCLITILPATIRNYAVGGDFVLISSNGGINLFIGNNEKANGLCSQELTGLGQFKTCYDYPAIVAEVEKTEGRKLKASEVSGFFSRKALDYMMHNPGTVAALTAKKAILFWGPSEISHNKVIQCERDASITLSLLPLNFPFIVSMSVIGFIGIIAVHRNSRSQNDKDASARFNVSILLIAIVLTSFLAILPFFVSARYRVPVIPILIIPASAGCWYIIAVLRVKQIRPIALTVGGWTAILILFSIPFVHYNPDKSDWHFARALAWEQKQQIDQAEAEYEKAIEINPGSVKSNYNLGNLLYNQGNMRKAAALFSAVVELEPKNVEATNNLANALANLGKLPEAITMYKRLIKLNPNDCQVRHNLAIVLTKARKHQEAADQYKAIINLCPELAGGHQALLGQALLIQRKIDESIPHLMEAAKHDPENAGICHLLGMAIGMQGKPDEAIDWFRKSLQIDPHSARTHLALADILSFNERLPEALAEYKEAFKLNPTLDTAREAIETLEKQISSEPNE